MDKDKSKADFPLIKKDDIYAVSKTFQMRYWCNAFSDLFDSSGKKKLPFFLDILSEDECWEKFDTIHGIRLNRRKAAKKMLGPQSCGGKKNPLNHLQRYRFACLCCEEDEIVALFEYFKQKLKIKDNNKAAIKLEESLRGSNYVGVDLAIHYWSRIVSGYESELYLNGKHLYEYGLDLVLDRMSILVEAVEYFWNKIKLLPENELSVQRKDEIFMRTAVYAAGSHCVNNPEVFEFCFSQISPDKYPELLRRDFERRCYYGSLNALMNTLRFDQFQELFDCLEPCNIPENIYANLLPVKLDHYSEFYADAFVKLFIHMWMKEGFDSHRALVLRNEMSCYLDRFLVSFVKRNYMEAVWVVLDKASPDQIKTIMSSKQSRYIKHVLYQRCDYKKFISYDSSVGHLSSSDTNLNKAHASKRYKIK